MKNKKALTATIVLILIAACAAVAYLAVNQKHSEPATSSQPSQSDSTSNVEESVSKDETTTESTTESTKNTTEETTTDEYAFIKKGCWYLADKDSEVCYAIAFRKEGKADIAYFNSDNIEGFDAQYSKGDAVYNIDGKKITLSKLPSVTGLKSLELEIEGNAILYKGKELKNFDKMNLDNALKCFE